MRIPRYLGLYLVVIAAILTIASLWKARHDAGQVSYSYIISVPVAVGLIYTQRWAVIAAGILGVGCSLIALGFATARSIFGLHDLEVGLGPFHLAEPSAGLLWIFTFMFLVVIGLPMSSMLWMKERAVHDT
jgi:hypothetical protein